MGYGSLAAIVAGARRALSYPRCMGFPDVVSDSRQRSDDDCRRFRKKIWRATVMNILEFIPDSAVEI